MILGTILGTKLTRTIEDDGAEMRAIFGLLLQPVLASAAMVVIWYVLFRHTGFHAPREDEVPLTAGAAASIAFYFGVTLAYVYPKTWERTEVLTRAIRRNDMARFLERRDDRIPLPIHVILFTLSGSVMFILMFLCYQATLSGIATVGIVAYVIATFWKAGRIFGNPIPLLKCQTPQHWLVADPQAYFKNTKEETARALKLVEERSRAKAK